MHNVYLTIGSNINPVQNLRQTLALLCQCCTVVAASPVYETTPVGYLDQDRFLNAAIHVRTSDDTATFKTMLLSIEGRLGRVRNPANKNAPRTIDLDIALWNRDVFSYGDKPWRVPDPDILRFIHVARPLADLEPDFRHPETGETLAAIADQLAAGDLALRQDFEWA